MTASTAVRAFIALGANLGKPLQSLRDARLAIAQLESVKLLNTSPAYQTPPWGVQDQPAYFNAVVAVECQLPARELLQSLLTIERQMGRNRQTELRWGARSIDLDILLFGDQIIHESDCHIPHPRIKERAFVLVPLLDVAGNILIPEQGLAKELLSRLDHSSFEVCLPGWYL